MTRLATVFARSSRRCARLVAAVALAGVASPMGDAAAATRPDFNGDGFADLAVGAPGHDIDGAFEVGSVSVIYGSNSGLASAGDDLWHLNKPGMPAPAQEESYFGSALSWGDFNGDGRDDLAISASGYRVNGVMPSGAVCVLYGSNSGLRTNGSQFWHQDSAGIQDEPQSDELFGIALAAGDFDNDGRDDLAIGIQEQLGGVEDSREGAVAVLYGSASGLKSSGSQFLHQDKPGFAGVAQELDRFGSALAAGDFDNDGRDDLAVGIIGEEVNAMQYAGAVQIIYGSNGGLKSARNRIFHQESAGIEDAPEAGDNFGRSLASGDFNNDGRADLAIGVAESLVPGNVEGAVHVLYGSSSGLKASGSQMWHQDKPGLDDQPEDGDSFGNELAAGDFDGDGRDDLAIGVAGESRNGVSSVGAVHVLYGAGSGLKSSGAQYWHQDKPGVNDSCEEQDLFGSALMAADFDNDGRDDLAIGVPDEDLAIPPDAVITDMTVQLIGLSHTFPSHMDIALMGPDGHKVMLMSDVGSGDNILNNITITLRDSFPSMPAFGQAIGSGPYKPTNHQPGDVLPGLTGQYGASLSEFNGRRIAGDWKLYIHDDFPTADNGSLGAWLITITTVSMGLHVGQIEIGATTSPYPSTITINDILSPGAVNVLYGSSSGLDSGGDQLWHRNQPSINGASEMGDYLGSSM